MLDHSHEERIRDYIQKGDTCAIETELTMRSNRPSLHTLAHTILTWTSGLSEYTLGPHSFCVSDSLIHIAAFYNQLTVLQWVANVIDDSEWWDIRRYGDRSSLVHIAASQGHTGVISCLIELTGASWEDILYAQRTDGLSVVEVAIAYGRVEFLEWLIRKCPLRHDLIDDGRVLPGTISSKYGKIECLQYLSTVASVRGYAVMDERDLNGWTCAHWAAHGGFLDVLQYIVENSLTVRSQLTNVATDYSNMYTPAYCAAQMGHVHVLEYLREKIGVQVLTHLLV